MTVGDERGEFRRRLNERYQEPLEVRIEGTDTEGPGRLMKLAFRGSTGFRSTALLVEPKAPSLWPGVAMVHPAPGDLDFFVEPARSLAREGIASLLVRAPWADPSWAQELTKPIKARETLIATFQEVGRAIDVLASLEGIDGHRLGYLGMSLGAMFGGLLVGLDQRLSAAVLMSGVGSFTDVAMLNMPQLGEKDRDRYRRVMEPIDPQLYVGRGSARLLFQYGTRDVFPVDKLIAFADAGSCPKTVINYDAGHFLDGQAQDDAVRWLVEQLGGPGQARPVPLAHGDRGINYYH
jgi:dienelactone hydrolase